MQTDTGVASDTNFNNLIITHQTGHTTFYFNDPVNPLIDDATHVLAANSLLMIGTFALPNVYAINIKCPLHYSGLPNVNQRTSIMNYLLKL